MSTYYQLLDLPEQASAADIRRAYRRLVLLTHPDRTPDPAAHARYLLINEAYETLSDPARRQYYDARLRWPAAPTAATPDDEPHPDPALRRRGRRRPRPVARAPVAPLHIRYAAEYERIVPRLRFVAVLSLLGALLVIIDFCRTQVLPHEVVQNFEYVHRAGGRNTTTYFIVSTQHAQFEVESTTELDQGAPVMVSQTPWFRKIRHVRPASGSLSGVELRTTSFGYGWVLIVIVVGSAAGTLHPRLRLDHAFDLGFVNSVVTILLAIFLFFM